MIACRDIGALAAEALLRPDSSGHQARELLGQRNISYGEASSMIGQAIGQPDLKYTPTARRSAASGAGKAGHVVQLHRFTIGDVSGLNSGYMRELEPRTGQNTTPTSFESYVADKFVPAYHRIPKAA